MSKGNLKLKDAEFVLKLYDLRREPVMRESRNLINGEFWPKNYEEAIAILQPTHHMNAACRQIATYWEMVYGFAKHGIIDADFLVESNGEGLFLYAKMLPYIDRMRAEWFPTAFQNTEWIVNNSEEGKQMLARMQAMMAKRAQAAGN